MNLLSDLADFAAEMENVNAFDLAKIESGVLLLFTRTSCPGKYFGRLTELAKEVVIGIFTPQEDGKNLSTLNPVFTLKLSLDLFEPNRRCSI
jgi:hypothetical protein